MDLFRRIGTQKKKFKVEFFIGRLKFSEYRAGKVYIVIKRGDHKVKSEHKLEMTSDNKLNFNKEILELEATLYFDEKDNKYQEKLVLFCLNKGELNVVLLDEKNNKILLGNVPFDLANYANSGQESIQEKRKLEQTPKKFSGLIEFNVFIKYIGEGSESSLDKASEFFFGKPKEETSNKNIIEKSEESIPPKKREDRSFLKGEKEKSKAKDKKIIDSEFNKYKVSQSKEKPKNQSKEKPQVKKINKTNTSEESYNHQEESENEQKVFYFDEPSTSREVKANDKIKVEKDSVLKSKDMKGREKEKIKKNTFHYDADEVLNNSQDEDIETSEVERVEVPENFGRSNVESINSEPMQSTNAKANTEKNFVKNRSKVEIRTKNDQFQEEREEVKLHEKRKESKSKKDEDLLSRKEHKKVEPEKQNLRSEEQSPFEDLYEDKRKEKKNYQYEKDYDEDEDNSPGVSPFRSPISIKETTSVLTKEYDTTKNNKNTSIEKEKEIKKEIEKEKINSDLPTKYLSLQKLNENLKIELNRSEQTIKQLENEKISFHQQISELSDQIEYYQLELKQKEEFIANFQYKNEYEGKTTTEKYLEDIKKIEREKNELIVENSKLKDKYQKDFTKFEQILAEKESQEEESLANLKAEIQRLKQENSSFREKIEKLVREKDEKTAESNKQKNINKNLEKELAEVKESLSQIKLKICNTLNEALDTGEESAIEILMELNKQ